MYIPSSAITAIRKSKVSLATASVYLDKCQYDKDETKASCHFHSATREIEEAYELLALILEAAK